MTDSLFVHERVRSDRAANSKPDEDPASPVPKTSHEHYSGGDEAYADHLAGRDGSAEHDRGAEQDENRGRAARNRVNDRELTPLVRRDEQ